MSPKHSSCHTHPRQSVTRCPPLQQCQLSHTANGTSQHALLGRIALLSDTPNTRARHLPALVITLTQPTHTAHSTHPTHTLTHTKNRHTVIPWKPALTPAPLPDNAHPLQCPRPVQPPNSHRTHLQRTRRRCGRRRLSSGLIPSEQRHKPTHKQTHACIPCTAKRIHAWTARALPGGTGELTGAGRPAAAAAPSSGFHPPPTRQRAPGSVARRAPRCRTPPAGRAACRPPAPRGRASTRRAARSRRPCR